MKHKFLTALALTALFTTPARADFLGLAPGDYAIGLQDANWGGLLNGMTGLVHIPDGPVTTSTFSWSFALRDSGGPVMFDWTGQILQIFNNPDGSSSAYEEASGPARLCDVGAYCYPVFELMYNPGRNNRAPCAEGGCADHWRDDYDYLFFKFGGWTAYRVPEPYPVILLGFGLLVLGIWGRKWT